MKKLFITVIATCQIISATIVTAAEQKGAFSLSAIAGGYTFEGTQHLKTAPLFGGRAGYNFTQNLGIEALFDYADTEGTKNSNSATMYRFGADVLFNLMPGSRFSPNLAVGISGLNVDVTGGDNGLHAAWSYGAGIKYFLTESIALRTDIRHIMYNNDYSTFNNLEYTVGVYIPFGASKTAASPAAALPPTTPAVAAGEEAQPPPTPAPSPAPAATQVIVPALNNITDSDGDGVRDSLDRCPKTPAGTTVDSNGCPKVDVPAQKSATAKRFCDKPAVLTVVFDSGKADVKAEYFPELSRVGSFLKEFPGSKGTIEGHTDSSGSTKSNIKLSQLRAESIRTYLINSFGIKPDRISAVGFGPAKPVAPNTTVDGKAKNRRIETVFSCE
ncbi:MAG: outer membrane beta-barrel domain-containing protein [Desulfuromonadaceae bacterium]